MPPGLDRPLPRGHRLGVVFVSLASGSWLERPDAVACPGFVNGRPPVPSVVRPSFGLGIAASKTPHPNQVRLKSLMTHTVFGVGLTSASPEPSPRSESRLKIWIDADAAPRDVKELVFRAAKRLEIETVLVANQRLSTPPGNPLVSAVWVDGGADVADQYIARHASAGDLVVTQDVPLAALLVPKAVAVLDPRGEEHTAETIGERLSVRDFMEQARIAGVVTGGPAPYDARAKQAFAAALDRVLTRLRRSA